MTAIAIITARGGSKRIPRKNLREFLGKPIICYSISAALQAECFDEVTVSTDDAEIAEVARRAGASVPFRRSAAASTDTATTADALFDVLDNYALAGREPDVACCLYPTAPFVTAEVLSIGARLLTENQELESVVPVVRFGYPIHRALTIKNERLSMMWPENTQVHSQDLPTAYHDAGQFYWFRVSAFRKYRSLFMQNTAPIVLPEWMVQDIDHEDDWILAEAKYQMAEFKWHADANAKVAVPVTQGA